MEVQGENCANRETVIGKKRTNVMTKNILIFICFTVSFVTFGQKKQKTKQPFDEEIFARRLLDEILADTTEQFKYQGDKLLKDTADLIEFAEPILFKYYTEKTIVSEKPYKIHYFDNYWVMYGTLHYAVGGTFIIIVDSRDCKVLRLIHEK